MVRTGHSGAERSLDGKLNSRLCGRGLGRVGWLPVRGLFLAALVVALGAVQASAQYIPRPNIPESTSFITEFGAVGDGTTLNTEAIQKTIDATAARGGGTVMVPAGRFLTGTFTLASNIRLHIATGATLLISNDMANYPILRGKDSPMAVDMYANAISGSDLHDVEITGEGTIDGQGEVWWKAFEEDRVKARAARARQEEHQAMTHRPNLIRLVRCTRLLVSDVTLQNSPMFHLIPEDCTDVTIENIKIIAPPDSPNTDGIDFSGWNYLITGCTVDVGDDHIVAKPVKSRKPGNRNIMIYNCTLLHGRGVAIGSTTTGGTEDMTVSYCTFKDSDYGIHIKSGRDRGGLVQRVRYENITLTNVRLPIYIQSYYADERRPRDLAAEAPRPITVITPTYRDITIRNVTATDCPTAGRIQCLPEMPIVNLTLDNVKISAKAGMRIYHVRGMKFVNSSVTAEEGNALEAFDAEISGLLEGQVKPIVVGQYVSQRRQAPASATPAEPAPQATPSESPATPGNAGESAAAGNAPTPAPEAAPAPAPQAAPTGQ